MERDRAAEHLQVIRTLMERSALYRRALAPVMMRVGIIGILAGLCGWFLGSSSFTKHWLVVCVIALLGAYVMVRKQAMQAREPFWSPPTRRVTQALLPPLFVGMVVTVMTFYTTPQNNLLWWFPPLWMALYGCAIHAAGFFMPRGMKWFGWIFLLMGCAVSLVLLVPRELPPLHYAHLLMGATFGGLHLAYGLYLYFTEPGKNEA